MEGVGAGWGVLPAHPEPCGPASRAPAAQMELTKAGSPHFQQQVTTSVTQKGFPQPPKIPGNMFLQGAIVEGGQRTHRRALALRKRKGACGDTRPSAGHTA